MEPCVSSIYLTYRTEFVWKTSLWIERVYFKELLKERHRRTGNFRPGGGGAVNHLPKFLQKSRKETRTIRCNNIGRTGIWKWLDTVFQGQYLPSLSINCVRCHKKTFGKIATTVVLDKVVIATKWRYYPLYLQHYFSLGNRSQELFAPIVASMFVKLKRNLYERYRDILG